MIFDLEGTHAAQAAHAAPPARPRRTQLEVYTHHVSTRLQQAEALGQSPLQALQTRLANYHPYDIVMLQNVFDAPPVPPRPLLFGGSSNSGGGGGGIAGGGGASGASTAGSGGGGGRSRASSPASSHSRGGGGGGGGGSSASRSRAASAAASDASAGDGNGDGDAAMPGTHAATAARALWRRAITMARRSSVGPAPSTHGGGLVSARLGAVDGRSKWYPVHGYNVCGTRAPVGAKPHARDAGLLIYSRFPIRSEAFVQFRDQTDETLCGVLLAEIEVDGIGRVLVCNVHFSSDATPEGAQIRTRQIHQLVSTIETMYAHLQQRVILSGSFNMNAVKNDVDGAQLLMLMWRLGLETAVNTHAHGLADMYARAGFSDNVRDYLFASRALGELVQLSVVDRPVETEAPGARVHLPLLGLLQISSSAGDC